MAFKKPANPSFLELASPNTWPKSISLLNWMNYWYPKICDAVGIDQTTDYDAMKWALNETLKPSVNIESTKKQYSHDNAIIFAPSHPIIPNFLLTQPNTLIIASEAVTGLLLKKGIVPHFITSDLDSNFSDLILAGSKGSILAIHVHGDNKDKIKGFFSNPETKNISFFFTTQTVPINDFVNILGFTDGDRAAFLGYFLGVNRIYLSGFELDSEPVNKMIEPSFFKEWYSKKKIKLEIAKVLLCWLSNFVNVVDLNHTTKWFDQCRISLY